MRITTRPATDEDREILAEIYASTRREQLAQVPWPAAQKEAFLRSQFDVQHSQYQVQYPDADFVILLRDGETIGRLYVDRRADAIRLIDIALLPVYRGSGIGTGLLRELMVEAERLRKPLQLHVEVSNPARRLYGRLGFRIVEDDGIHHFMEWCADAD